MPDSKPLHSRIEQRPIPTRPAAAPSPSFKEGRPAPIAPSEAPPIQEQQEVESRATTEAPATSLPSTVSVPSSTPATTPASVAVDEEIAQIESILSEGLEDEYNTMPPAVQAIFRKEGERIAAAIQLLLEHSRAAARQIADLIRKWLGMIPGVNRFFLEQEAKIKTDQLLELRRTDFK